jgi:hypothetical protein
MRTEAIGRECYQVFGDRVPINQMLKEHPGIPYLQEGYIPADLFFQGIKPQYGTDPPWHQPAFVGSFRHRD